MYPTSPIHIVIYFYPIVAIHGGWRIIERGQEIGPDIGDLRIRGMPPRVGEDLQGNGGRGDFHRRISELEIQMAPVLEVKYFPDDHLRSRKCISKRLKRAFGIIQSENSPSCKSASYALHATEKSPEIAVEITVISRL